MPEKSNYEKYLAGEPLNDELRALQAGEPVVDGRLRAAFYAGDDSFAAAGPADRSLSRADRELLKEARVSGVLAIIETTLKKALETHIRSATMDAENDPLGRAGEISRQWAYVVMYRRALLEFQQLVDAEIAELDSAQLLERHQTERAAG